jgi:hypothetical protein
MSRNYNNFEKPELISLFISECEKIGHKVIITCVDRDHKEQYAYFLQGREPLHIVNQFRKFAGLYPIDREENKRIITWTLNSEHIVNLEDNLKDNDKSRAIDFAILKPGSKQIDWNVKADVNKNNIPDYLECALVGEKIGFYSGGRFNKNKDYPHLQLKKIEGLLG